MFVKELWRYPVKSLAGESVSEADLTLNGILGDRDILVIGKKRRVITSRTHHRLLGLKGTLDHEGFPRISGHAWNSPEALALVSEAVGAEVRLVRHDGPEKFDILSLLVATDGAIAHMGFDGRRLRPNIVIGGVKDLEERQWPGRTLRIGDALIRPAQLRARCVMTTYDPDTLEQDNTVLRRIVKELEGTMALDTAVLCPGRIRVGDRVTLLDPDLL